VRRLMRVMGITAIYQRPNTSKPHPEHQVFPYLLRGLAIGRANQVWCADITYIPMARGFVYLVAIMDWFSRRVLAWRLSIAWRLNSVCKPWSRHSLITASRIFSTPTRAHNSPATILSARCKKHDIQISMDGRGRYLDNIFIERLWRSLKYEEVFTHAYVSVADARGGIGKWVLFYNDERLHQALDYQTPREIFEAAPACGHVDNARALTTCPQAQQQQRERNSIDVKKALDKIDVPRTGSGTRNRRDSLLASPVSCPRNGDHLSYKGASRSQRAMERKRRCHGSSVWPQGQGSHFARRDDIARLLGYGVPRIQRVLDCASNRATLVGTGTIYPETALLYRVPIPDGLDGTRRFVPLPSRLRGFLQ